MVPQERTLFLASEYANNSRMTMNCFLRGQSAVRSQTNIENEKYHNLYKRSHNKTIKSSLIKALLLPVNPNLSYYMVNIIYFKYIAF